LVFLEAELAEKAKGIKKSWETWELTAYTADPKENGGYSKTASGEPFQDNHTVACPKTLPFGTKVEIEGIGIRECQDRGGSIKGNRLDVFIRDAKEMERFGRKKCSVRRIEETGEG